MNIEPEKLTENGYVELDRLSHQDLVPFIRTYMKKRTKYAILYQVANLMVFGLTGFLFTVGIHSSDYSLPDRLTHFSYGLAIAFALLPVHEYIHVLAYKSQGAKKTSYYANIKKFYFMALADRFVTNKKEFQIVALAPFVFISSSLLLLLFVVSGTWVLTIAGALLVHTIMCAGDFGLLSYFDFHTDKQVVTYDDISSKLTLFFAKPNTSENNMEIQHGKGFDPIGKVSEKI
jgi:hypothetical protein